jgi:hypothetical protein
MGPETTRLAPAAAEGAGHPHKQPCPLCDPAKDCKGEAHGWLHRFALIRVVGAGLTQPVVARLKENLPLLAAAVRVPGYRQHKPNGTVVQADAIASQTAS